MIETVEDMNQLNKSVQQKMQNKYLDETYRASITKKSVTPKKY